MAAGSSEYCLGFEKFLTSVIGDKASDRAAGRWEQFTDLLHEICQNVVRVIGISSDHHQVGKFEENPSEHLQKVQYFGNRSILIREALIDFGVIKKPKA